MQKCIIVIFRKFYSTKHTFWLGRCLTHCQHQHALFNLQTFCCCCCAISRVFQTVISHPLLKSWESVLNRFLFCFMQDYAALEKERGSLVRSRHLQYLLAFSFWPNGEPRAPSNIYEIRSYRFVWNVFQVYEFWFKYLMYNILICDTSVWSRALWSSGATTGLAVSLTVAHRTKLLLDTSRKLDDFTTFITFGVSLISFKQ